MSKRSLRKPERGMIGSNLLLMLAGALVGIAAAMELVAAAERCTSLGEYLFALAWLIVVAVGTFYVQILLHESGHLLFGLLSGYRFVSFRIGSWMVQKEHGTLCLHRYTLAGTAGQCLLAPPEMTDGKIPYRLYNLGGVLMNLLTAGLAAGLAVLYRGVWPVRIVWEMLCVVGAVCALSNGIPMRVQGVANDGANARDMGKDPAALRAFWIQLSINAKQAEGVPVREMPAEWFAMPAEGLDNIMLASQAVLHMNYLMDGQHFAETARAIDALEAQQTAMLPLHRNLLLCDRLVCALLIGEDASPWVKRWKEPPMRTFRKQMKDFLTVLRTEYAVALLVEGDRAEAEKIRARFEKRVASYPYAAERDSERALLTLLAKKAVS